MAVKEQSEKSVCDLQKMTNTTSYTLLLQVFRTATL